MERRVPARRETCYAPRKTISCARPYVHSIHVSRQDARGSRIRWRLVLVLIGLSLTFLLLCQQQWYKWATFRVSACRFMSNVQFGRPPIRPNGGKDAYIIRQYSFCVKQELGQYAHAGIGNN